MSRRLSYCGFVLAIVLPLGAAWSPAAAQDVLLTDDSDDPALDPQQGRFEVGIENFEQWIFGVQNGAEAFRQKRDTLLKLRIDELERACGGLSEIQKRKMLLAGRGDMKRFDERVAEARDRFEKARFDQNKFNQIWQEIQPIQMAVQSGMFGRDSIFQKSILKTLKPEQCAKYQELDNQRQAFRYRARVELFVASVENTCPLSGDQRDKLIQLILAESKPPRAFGQYDTYVVMYQLAKINEEKLKPLFDETQWKAFSIHIAQGRGMEQFLRQNGMLEATGEDTQIPFTEPPAPQ